MGRKESNGELLGRNPGGNYANQWQGSLKDPAILSNVFSRPQCELHPKQPETKLVRLITLTELKTVQ